MRNKTPRTDLLIALFIGGLLLFNYPVLSLFSTDGNVFGLPSLYVYLFSAWGSFILCLRLILGRRGGSETSMLPQWLLILAPFTYLGLLFLIAWYADRLALQGRTLVDNPYVYTLSIAVYCTAWTFYGSVGRAAEAGVEFLTIYLGPTLMAGLWWLVLRKIIRISKQHRITSIADFIASRYGKSMGLGGLATFIAVLAVTPYIALQLKGIADSFEVLLGHPESTALPIAAGFWDNKALYVAMLLALFSILFGTRHIDTSERLEGMVVAVAFESLIKLIAFLSAGVFITFFLFSGPQAIFAGIAEQPDLAPLLQMQTGAYGSWFVLILVSMAAIVLLPRQFQVTVVENVDEEHLRTAAWLFPLYLLLINLFVLPIAFAGLLYFNPGDVNPDNFVLALPLAEGRELLALFVYIGGFSAATGMVIVATIALAIMVSNDLLMPILLRIRHLRWIERIGLQRLIVNFRRIIILALMLLGYTYYRWIAEGQALVSIGLVSFVGVAQFAPAILAGMYWKGASRLGALAGLACGFGVWIYTLLLPSLATGAAAVSETFVTTGPFGIESLRPYGLFGLEGLDPISHAVFWSLLINSGMLVLISLFARQSEIERIQATLFVDVFQRRGSDAGFWQGIATVGALEALLARFIGSQRAADALAYYHRRRGRTPAPETRAEPALVNYVERLLSGSIGAASARVMVSSIVEGEALTFEGVMEILDATSQAIEYSRRLEQKSHELERTSQELRAANERLKELDRLKDEFVSTVSHELRTPLTSIRAFAEILLTNAALDSAKQQQFLEIMVAESERLTRLINKVLDFRKLSVIGMNGLWRH
ncbi:histidine kinase dimerization/phospho-acceptor domain-containing protein [Alkalilimnicola ehrlichii]|uniref:histidine kinase dimerization/phospho-acceptor domain-containing protein n=1 Tax=Alkalilimnicola ehrlichii TaxID=351052 RepID=UPI0021614F2E|nr:histidine kinase dimerization/phospho-acceptor domain-containing protein [Alkalilimnicola ehrlichii]